MITRSSLPRQTAIHLEAQLKTGRWKERLPSERALAAECGVSRRVVREALQVLARAGHVRLAARRPAVILRKRIAAKTRRVLSVAVLGPEPWAEADAEILRALQVFGSRLQEAGTAVNYWHGPQFYRRSPTALRRLVTDHPHDAWVVFRSTFEMQQALAQAGTSIVVFGTSAAESGLPCIGTDYGAACRHGVGQFLRLGLRRMFLLVPAGRLGGVVDADAAFTEACGRAGSSAEGRIIVFPDDPQGITRAVEEMLRAAGSEPFGVLVNRPRPSLLVLTHLLRRGIAVPARASVVSLDWSPLLEYISPAIAGYGVKHERVGSRLADLALTVAGGAAPRQPRQLIVPDFHPGATLRRAALVSK